MLDIFWTYSHIEFELTSNWFHDTFQVKCYVQTAAIHGKTELQEGLDIIESTKLKYFTKEMTAEFYALKG